MTTPTTSKDLARAFARFLDAAEAAKLGTAAQRKRWNYSTGSRYYGNSFKLYQVGADTVAEAKRTGHPHKNYPYGSGHYNCADLPTFLGWSKAEAVATLDAYAAALWAPIRSRQRAAWRRELAKTKATNA